MGGLQISKLQVYSIKFYVLHTPILYKKKTRALKNRIKNFPQNYY
jgi:hypothetical protein